MRSRWLTILMLFSQFVAKPALSQQSRFKVLAFYSANAESDHVQFAQQAVKFLEARAATEHFTFESTTKWADLNDERLKTYQLVIWLTESPSNAEQRHAFERYMERGGAWLGFHAAGYNDSDTNWPWFVDFLGGAVFYTNSWPQLPARIVIDDPTHPVALKLPGEFESPANEWYIWKPSPRLNKNVRVLATFDPSNYPLGLKDVLTGGDLPVVWTNSKYKMLYMNMGHGDKIFSSPAQNQLIDNAVNWLGMGTPENASPEASGVRISPQGVALNPQTGKFYAVNTGQGTVNVLSGDSKFLSQVHVGTEPISIAINPQTNRVYVGNTGSGSVTVIDGSTDKAIATVAVGDLPHLLAANPASNKVYVSRTFSNDISVIDGNTNSASSMNSGVQAVGIAVDVAANRILLTNYGSQVAVIDGETGNISHVEAGTHLWAVASNAANHKTYATDATRSNVTVIDGKTNSTRSVPAGEIPCAVAVDSNLGRVFVANYGSGNVTVIDGANDSVVATVHADAKPQAIAVDSVNHTVYVASPHERTITILEGTQNKVVATVKAAGAPFAIAVNSKTHKAVAVGLKGELTVIDGITLAASSPEMHGTEQ